MVMTNHIFHDAIVIRLHGDFQETGGEILETSSSACSRIVQSKGCFQFNRGDIYGWDGNGKLVLCSSYPYPIGYSRQPG